MVSNGSSADRDMLEQENLTVEKEGLTSQIAEARADIKLQEEEKNPVSER